MQFMTIVSISLNDKILEEVDRARNELGFSGRSETIRAGIRMFISETKEIKLAAKTLAKNLKISIDLHTKNGSVFSDGKDIFFVKSWRDIIIKRLTGAGDSWDAADILGHLSGLNPNERLFFANIFAALYISQEDRRLITLDNVIQFYNKLYKITNCS